MHSIQILPPIKMTGHNGSVFSVTAGTAPEKVLSGAGDGWIVEWNLDNPEMGQLLAKVETNIFCLHYLPQIHQVVAGNMYGGVHWVNLEKPEQTKNIAHHKKGVFAILELGDYLFTGGGDGQLTRWSIAKQRSLESLYLSNQSLRSIDFSPARNELAVGASDGRIYLLDADSLALNGQIDHAHDHSVFSVKYHPNNNQLLSGGRDAHLRVWNLKKPTANGQPTLDFDEATHWFTINAIAFHPKQSIFATASRDKTIRIWDSEDYRLLKSLDFDKYRGHLNSVNDLYWSAHRNLLVSGSDDRTLATWEMTC